MQRHTSLVALAFFTFIGQLGVVRLAANPDVDVAEVVADVDLLDPVVAQHNDSKSSKQLFFPPAGHGFGQVFPDTPVILTSHHPGHHDHHDASGLNRSQRRRLRRLLRRLLQGQRESQVPEVVPVPAVAAVPVLPGLVPFSESSFEGSYVAVSGRPGERTVHIVNGRSGEFAGTILRNHVIYERRPPEPVVPVSPDFDYDFEPDPVPATPQSVPQPQSPAAQVPDLPRCSYINTEFIGDDVGDGKGLTAATPHDCKNACQRQQLCFFWTFRPKWARGCYLKRGGRRGSSTTASASPREGFISGTKGDSCVCLPNVSDEEEQVCPTDAGKRVFPWHRRRPNGVGFDGTTRFDYDDGDVVRIRPTVIDDGFVEPVTLPPPVGITPGLAPNVVVANGGRRSRPRPAISIKDSAEVDVVVPNEKPKVKKRSS